MVLVGYASDSEASDDETVPPPQTKAPTESSSNNSKRTTAAPFAVDKSNPKIIRVNLSSSAQAQSRDAADQNERAAKRQRTGAGAFSGFNAMLPAPKRDNEKANGTVKPKSAARKVFSLKTGAEPAFSRENDEEMKRTFAERDVNIEPNQVTQIDAGDGDAHKPSFIAETTTVPIHTQGKPLMFKPLSVARNAKKKKPAIATIPSNPNATNMPNLAQNKSSGYKGIDAKMTKVPAPSEKISLFSAGPSASALETDEAWTQDDEDEIIEVLDDNTPPVSTYPAQQMPTQSEQSLTSLADNLNLSAAERRQLFGRGGQGTHNKIINFNTDVEYAANQAHIAAGEQVQHNPVRAIAPGKHSLKSLVASAQGQSEALEESFAAGRRNKKEAGSKYGW